MKRIVIVVAALALAAPAFAADDVMSNYYGNTVVSTGGMGEAHSHYKADGTFDISMSAGGQSMATKGTWKLDNGQLCRTYENPPPGLPNPFCTPWDAHKVGDTWTMAAGGMTRTVTLKAGIE